MAIITCCGKVKNLLFYIQENYVFIFKLSLTELSVLSQKKPVWSQKKPVRPQKIFFEKTLPTTGEKKIIDCQAVRVKEMKPGTIPEYEVAAIAVSKEAVKDYKDMMRKRGL